MVAMSWMPAYDFGGLFADGRPVFVVVHSTESENTPGSAEATAGPGWFGGPKAGTSAHKIVDVDSIVEGVKRNRIAWHVGPNGNGWGIGYEFCGRASWSYEQWRRPENLQMLANAAPYIADDLRAIGAPIRWLSQVQVATHQPGLCTHNDIRLALGGTTHSDPGPNFPYAELLAFVNAAAINSAPVVIPVGPGPVVVPSPTPAPQPAAGFPFADHRQHFGDITGPADCHGGYTAPERVWVRQIQEALKAKGFNPGVIDGVWNSPTTVAMAAYQHAVLPKTTARFGECWFDDWAYLVDNQPVPAQDTPHPNQVPAGVDPNSLPSLAFGQTSDAVKSLQRFLNAYNWRPALPLLPVTGYFGPSTANVLHHAGQQMGIVGDADGKNLGPQFKAKLAARGWTGK